MEASCLPPFPHLESFRATTYRIHLMFVTSPHFQMDVPRSLLTDDRKCWRTIELSFNGPWFILTYRKREGRTAFDHRLLVWLSADVLQILTLEPAPTVVGLDYVSPPNFGGEKGWQIQPIREIWRAQDAAVDGNEFLVFRDADGQEFREPGAYEMEEHRPSRELVMALS